MGFGGMGEGVCVILGGGWVGFLENSSIMECEDRSATINAFEHITKKVHYRIPIAFHTSCVALMV